MTKLRVHAVKIVMGCALLSGGCTKAEPDLPTFDPLDKVSLSEGWKVGQSIAVSPGEKRPMAHHVQAIASGLHNVDLDTPPVAMTPIAPSCEVKHPGMGGGKYLVIGNGAVKFPLMKKADLPGLMVFSNKTANQYGKEQALAKKNKGVRAANALGSVSVPGTNMRMTDIFITETSETVIVALAGGGLYNFNMAPNVRLASVIIYTNTDQAAVVGVPDHVPVQFISKTHEATRGCWTRIQARPDQSWPKRMRNGPRFEALKPHWKNFEKRVRKDIGLIRPKNVVSVNRTNHVLIGPAPTRYEDRLPYVAFAGQKIRYMAADHAQFGSPVQNGTYARQVLDQYYEAHLKAGKS